MAHEVSELFGKAVLARDVRTGALTQPTAVRDHEGNLMFLEDLPSPNVRRWVFSRKAKVVAAVIGGLLQEDEALRRYNISLEEFRSWQDAIKNGDIRALCVTRLECRPQVKETVTEANQEVAMPEAGGVTFGDVSIDPKSRVMSGTFGEVHLTLKEQGLLLMLAESPHTVGKRAIFSRLYTGARKEPESKVIDVFICHLRRKLGVVSHRATIETVWGRGYRLVLKRS